MAPCQSVWLQRESGRGWRKCKAWGISLASNKHVVCTFTLHLARFASSLFVSFGCCSADRSDLCKHTRTNVCVFGPSVGGCGGPEPGGRPWLPGPAGRCLRRGELHVYSVWHHRRGQTQRYWIMLFLFYYSANMHLVWSLLCCSDVHL